MNVCARIRDERGAIAILAALLVVLVLVPLSAAALTAHVRGGALAELQRAADSGALAGAASIPLGDVSFVNTYVARGPLSGYFLPGAPDPLTVACEQARRAIAADGRFGDRFGSPLGADFCTATYTPDLTFAGDLAGCLAIAGPLVPPDLVIGVRRVLPALLHAGVQVTLRRGIDGPLDGLMGGGPPTQTVTAAAKRRFKNAVVVPIVPAGPLGTLLPPPLAPGSSIDLNPALDQTVDGTVAALRELDAVLGPVLAAVGCGGLLDALADDLGDLVNPPAAGAPTIEEVIRDAARQADYLFVLRIPPDPTGVLGIPFFDFVPVCVEEPGPDLQGIVVDPAPPISSAAACSAHAPGGFRASLIPVGAP